jgi:carbon monoxide dehydrogenase subunit G
MKFAASYTLSAPRDKIFMMITDPAVLQRCIPGCEKMERTSDDNYDAHLKIGIAGLKGNYVGKVQLVDKRPPESYTLIMEGKGSPGFVKGTARIHLTAKDSGTELGCNAEAQVGGMIAAVGSRLIEAVGKKLMDDFFKKFGQEVSMAA